MWISKGFSTEHWLLAMGEKLRKGFNRGETSAALLTGLSRASDCVSHDLLIAELHADGVKEESLNLFFSLKIGNEQFV